MAKAHPRKGSGLFHSSEYVKQHYDGNFPQKTTLYKV